VGGAKVNYGCLDANSVQDIDGDLYWLSYNRAASPQVVMMSGVKAEVVSTKWIDKLLEGADFTTVYSFFFKDGGHKFYVLTIKNANLTLVYDAAEKSWAQWTDASGNYLPFVACTFDSSKRRIWQHESNGKLYYANQTYTNDDGSIVTVDIITPNWDGNTQKTKSLSKLFFLGDRVIGSSLYVRCNDYDYDANKWTNFRFVDMGQKTPFLDRCGSFQRRAYHLRHRGNQAFRIAALEMQLGAGSK
jgi:hypothetical protein